MGLVEFRIHAVVPDQGIRHGHNLTGIRRIGQYFLVTGHPGIEHHFAVAFPSVQQQPVKCRPIGQYQLAGYKFAHAVTCPSRITILPATTVSTACPFKLRSANGLALPRV